MITKRDREIINYIYSIGFVTIDQCAKLYYSNSKYSYDLARRRLKKIAEQADYIKPMLNTETKQTIYIPSEKKVKRISKHDILVLDYLAALKTLDFNIEKIEITPNFGGVIPDAFIQYTFNKYRYCQLVELQLRHDYVDILRYNKPDTIAAIMEKTNKVKPKLIIIQDTNKNYNKENNTLFKIIQLNTKLDEITKVLLE